MTSLPNRGPEEQLLAWLCSVTPDRGPGASVFQGAHLDWPRFVELVHVHRVAPLVWRNLQRLAALAIPDEASREIRDAQRQNALRSLRQTSHLIRIMTALSAAGIRAMPLKGVCLALRYYHGVSARHAGDIDLLVAPSQMTEANDVLLANGFRRVWKGPHQAVTEPFSEETDWGLHLIYMSEDRALLELHFRLHYNPDVLPIPFAEMLASAQRCLVGDLALPVMPDPLQFVFLSTHGSRHEWERLQWLCDIAVMVHSATSQDLQQWLALAHKYRLTNPVVQALVLAERFLGIRLPEDVTRAYDASIRIRYMVARAERKLLGKFALESDRPVLNGRRIYRLCVTNRPAYLLHELRDATKAVRSNFRRLAAQGQAPM